MLRNVNKLLSLLLAVLMGLSVLAVTAAAADDAAAAVTYKTVTFGIYPQARVTDRSLITRLNTVVYDEDSFVTLDGVTYCAQQVPPKSIPGIAPFAIAYDYHPGVTYWFRCAPIVWRVLENKDGEALLFADQVLTARAFNESIKGDNTWANSDLRAWLNGAFLKSAFSAEEQAYIHDSALENARNLITGVSGGVNTTDKVYIPSFDEMTTVEYGFNDVDFWRDAIGDFGEKQGYYYEDPFRQATATDFAKCRSIWANLDLSDEEETPPVKTCRFWLRTPGEKSTYAIGGLEDGRLSATGWPVNTNIMGVRPMMRVDAAVLGGVEPDDMPFHVTGPEGEVHYKQRGLKFTADEDVKWRSSNPSIVSIDANGEITIKRVGTVTISAISKETGRTVAVEMEISYTWWQQIVRIVLFGWIWY